MNFGPDHYVPVLKTKQGEKAALRQVSKTVQARMTPLLEIPERAPRGKKPPRKVREHIDIAFRKLDDAVAPFKRFFIDCREIAPDGHSAAAEVFGRADEFAIQFTPVTGISRSVDVKAALGYKKLGIAIRLTRADYESNYMARDLNAFMKKHGLSPEGVDLILDLGPVDDMIEPGVEALDEGFLSDVPDPSRWRTLTISGSAFPLSMGVVDTSSYDLIDRIEWQAWRDALYSSRSRLARLPTFSDAAIQHPRGVEGFDFTFMKPSASTRITTGDQWLLIKGVGVKKVSAAVQFPLLATQLVEGDLRAHFATENHCAGCAGMKLCAKGGSTLGTARAWRRLGTVHHLTCVTEQIGALTWP